MKKALEIISMSRIRKTKEKSTKKEIIADYREKNSFVIKELISLGLEIKIKNLKVGDYLVNGVAIERKTVSDFISSMINKRLLRQLKEIQQYKNKILIIEGIYENELYSCNSEEIGMHPNAIRGFLLSILLKYKIPIIFTENFEDTAKFIYVLSEKKEKENSLNVNKKFLNKKERMQFILEGFPGIGPKTAKKLLLEFKTLQNIMNADIGDLKKIIGKKAEIFNIVKEKY